MGIFDDDLAMDIKGLYDDLISKGYMDKYLCIENSGRTMYNNIKS